MSAIDALFRAMDANHDGARGTTVRRPGHVCLPHPTPQGNQTAACRCCAAFWPSAQGPVLASSGFRHRHVRTRWKVYRVGRCPRGSRHWQSAQRQPRPQLVVGAVAHVAGWDDKGACYRFAGRHLEPMRQLRQFICYFLWPATAAPCSPQGWSPHRAPACFLDRQRRRVFRAL
jgi:hypothetical protein